MKKKILLVCILMFGLVFGNIVFANESTIDANSIQSADGNITEEEWKSMVDSGQIQIIASDSQLADIYTNQNGERAVNRIRINVSVGYESVTNSMIIYSNLYSENPYDNPQFTSASGGVTVTGKKLFASDPIAVTQSPKKILSFSNRIQDSRFKSGESYTVQVGGRATGNNIVGGSGAFGITTSARIP